MTRRNIRTPHPDAAGAFTLIELMVVVAIIVALLAILMPSMGKAIAVAEAAACGSNVRQIGLATTSYQAENRRFFPGHHTTGGEVYVAWTGRLLRYVGQQREVFYCPTAPAEAKWVKTTGYSGTAHQNGYDVGERPILTTSKFSYGYNDWGIEEFTNPHLGLGAHVGSAAYGEVPLTRLRAPADMIVFADSTPDGKWDTAIDPKGDWAGSTNELPSDRHYGGAQVIWADGHVSHQKMDTLIDLSDNGVRRRWNSDNEPHAEYGG